MFSAHLPQSSSPLNSGPKQRLLRYFSVTRYHVLAMLLLVFSGFSHAESVTRVNAISLHGTPKYIDSGYYHVNPAAPKRGSLVLPGFGSFDTLNPYVLKGISPVNSPGMGQYGIAELNETLMVGTGFLLPSPDEAQTAYCLICEYVEYPADYRWVRFKLRDTAKFHNGEPMTTDDVVTSFKLLTSEKAHPSYRDIYQPVARVEKDGPLTVTFYLKEPHLKPMVFRLGELPVMSHAFWQTHTFGESSNVPQPLSGPYKVGQVSMGSFIEFERAPDFWAKDFPLYQGMYNFDKVRFEFFRDRTVAFEAFKSGRVDVFYEYVAKNWATAYDFPDINSGQVVREEIVHEIPSGSQAFFINTRRAQFADLRVRKALTLLFDYEWTNTNIFAGAYKRSNTYFPNSELGARSLPSQGELKLLKPYKNELPVALFTEPFQLPQTRGNGNIRPQLREALALFKQAGWEVRNAKLVNTQTDEPFHFEILIDQNSFARVLTPYINNLNKAGISAEIRHIDTAQYKVRLDNLDFDMISFVLPQGLSPSHEQRLYFHSSLADTEGTKNYSGVKNKVVDAMIEQIINAKDRKQLISATRAMDRVLLWNYYTIPHWHLNYHRIAYRSKLQRPGQVSKLALGFPSWWIKPTTTAGAATQ